MSNRVNTRKRVLIVVGIVALACMALGMGAAVAGGAVYALTRGTDWLGQWAQEVSLPLSSQKAVDDAERAIVIAPTADDEEPGIVIAAVTDAGPADVAGVERGDILLELDGEAVNSQLDLLDTLEGLEPGDEVELRLLHGDDERRLTATLEERDGETFLGVAPCCAFRESEVTLEALEHISAGGALITDVVEDSPADDAGLEAGDIVLAVDGEELGDKLALADAIGAHQPGDRVTLTVSSQVGDEERELMVELDEHPDEEGVAYLGVTYLPASAHVRRFRLPDDWSLPPRIERFREVLPGGLPGVIIVEVDVGSPAEKAGLREGDVILSIDGETVDTPQDVVSAVTARESGDELTMTIFRLSEDDEDEKLELSITLGEHPEDEARAYLGVRLGFGGVHLKRFGGKWGPEGWHREFELPEHWDMPFDLDDLPHRFEFEFSPQDDVDDREVLPGDNNV